MNIKPILSRITTLMLASVLIIGTTGCSVIMGVFGMEEKLPTETAQNSVAERTLLPTPAAAAVDVEVTPTAAAEEPTPTPTMVTEPVAPAPTAPPRRAVTITGPSVNLRSQPGTDAQILRTVPAGTTFDFVDQNSTGDWYQVCCVDNQVAWVFAELATVDQAAPASETVMAMQAEPAAAVQSTANQGPKLTSPVRPVTLDIPLNPPIFTESEEADGIRYEYSEQGFAITLPTGWQPIDLSRERLANSLIPLAQANPEAASLVMEQLQSIANARFTFFATELTPAVLDTRFATNVSLWRQPLPDGITLDFYSQLTAKQVQEKYELISPISLTPGALPAGKSVTLSYTMRGAASELAVTTYLIMQGQTVYAITFTTTAPQAETYAPTFDAIVQSFSLLDQ